MVRTRRLSQHSEIRGENARRAGPVVLTAIRSGAGASRGCRHWAHGWYAPIDCVSLRFLSPRIDSAVPFSNARAVKMENILLSYKQHPADLVDPNEPSHLLKIADFGLSLVNHPVGTRIRPPHGTASYMAVRRHWCLS